MPSKLILAFMTLTVFCGRLSAQDPEIILDLMGTDKARYSPGDTVVFGLAPENQTDGLELYVRYRHLNETIREQTIPVLSKDTLSWTWQTPLEDYKGYLVEIFLRNTITDSVLVQSNVAVDVSSSWRKFPRYGFLSKFPSMSEEQMDGVISRLNRCHINGLQFYDWHYRHHMPLKGTPENPAPTWKDIANRTNYFSTIEYYIEAAHNHNMKAMCYNLLYGALDNAESDGVSDEWYLFKDASHFNRDVIPLPFWGNNIYVMDPHNQGWRDYIFSQTEKVFLALPFDGWHIDQLGDRGNVWNYQGEEVIIKDAFQSFIEGAKSYLNVDLVMNAVNQYGQEKIVQSPVDFLYTEVWHPNVTYGDLAAIITDNLASSNGALSTVVAAYVNHDLAESPGVFNTPAVLLADAVIFVSGGAHIELGEHMLGHEYFPNENLSMSEELEQQLVCYYDFLVAYENLLRDGGVLGNIDLNSEDVSIGTWPPRLGKVATLNKEMDNRQVIHLINFLNATTLDWRDNRGTQPEPNVIEDLPLSFERELEVENIWMVSPDYYMGSPIAMTFTQEDGQVSLRLPMLKYWTMVVVKYDTVGSGVEEHGQGDKSSLGFVLADNYPNPFNPTTSISYTIPDAGFVALKVYDVLGREVQTLVGELQRPGTHSIRFDASRLSSGIYFYKLHVGRFVETRKMLLL